MFKNSHQKLVQMFIATLFIIVKKMGKPKYLLADEQIKWYAHTVEYYSTIKTCYNMEETWRYAQQNTPVIKDHRLYDSACVKCPE